MLLVRKLLPWVVSVAAHAGLILVPVSLARGPAAAPPSLRRVELVFDSGPAVPPTGAAAASAGSGEAVLAPAGMELPRSVPVPAPARSVPPAPSAPAEAALLTASAPMAPVSSLPGLPSPADVLAGLPTVRAPAPVPSAQPAPSAAEPADSSPLVERIGWQGTARTVVRRVSPRFPPALSARGQEVECEAAITVTPLGTVVDVEITRSSGYTEVDASVEAALRQYVFSRVEGRQNVEGTVSFQFRLERRD
jgi:TonB family protein